MDEINYNELFEVNEGAKEQEAAEPAAVEETDEQTAEQPAEAPAEDTEEPSEQQPAEQVQQTAEENARYAAARRKAEAERDAAVAKAREDAQKQMDEVIQGLGITNPYTKTLITNRAEYEAYRQQVQADRRDRIIKKAGMSEPELKEFIGQLPEVKAAQEAQHKAEQEAAQARRAAAEVKIQEQIAEITKLDPSIQALGDLTKMKNAQQFYELVKRGNNFVDAYKLANFERLTQQAATVAKKAALQAEKGKAHLSKTESRGTGSASVPEDIKAEYRAFMPEATDEEISKHYNRYLKGAK